MGHLTNEAAIFPKHEVQSGPGAELESSLPCDYGDRPASPNLRC